MRNLVMSAIISAMLFMVSCGGAEPAPASTTPTIPTPSPTTAVDAKALYSNNCSVCHGPKRQGVSGLGPALTPTSLAKLSEAEVKDIILKGRPETPMVGFEGRLSSEEIDALVQFTKQTSP